MASPQTSGGDNAKTRREREGGGEYSSWSRWLVTRVHSFSFFPNSHKGDHSSARGREIFSILPSVIRGRLRDL